jgi:hypothetical protein
MAKRIYARYGDCEFLERECPGGFLCYICSEPYSEYEGAICRACGVVHCNACEREGIELDPDLCLECMDDG